MAVDLTTFYDGANEAGMLSAASRNGTTITNGVLFANDASDVLGMEGNGPFCRVPTSRVSGATQGDTMVVDGVNYVIASVRLDTPHLGESSLILRKA